MLLLADENQHPVVVGRLREAGHEVEYVRETSPGATDEDILSRGDITAFVLITDDRDFGDLIFNRGYPAPYSILYARLSRVAPERIADRLIGLLAAGIAERHMISVTKDGERVKPFPPGAVDV